MSLLSVLETVRAKFSVNMDLKLEKYIADTLWNRISTLYRQNNLWFSKVTPDPMFTTNFPIATVADLVSLDVAGYRWPSAGWLYVVDGTSTYEVYNPVYPTSTASTTHLSNYWLKQDVKNIDTIYEYDLTGSQVGEIAVLGREKTMAKSNYGTANKGHPNTVSLYKNGFRSFLVFNPVPDGYYLYQVAYSLASPTPFDTPESTNQFMENYPDVVVNMGLQAAAEHYEKWDTSSYYNNLVETALKGIIKEQIRQDNGDDGTFRIYRTRAAALHKKTQGYFYATEWGSLGAHYVTTTDTPLPEPTSDT